MVLPIRIVHEDISFTHYYWYGLVVRYGIRPKLRSFPFRRMISPWCGSRRCRRRRRPYQHHQHHPRHHHQQ